MSLYRIYVENISSNLGKCGNILITGINTDYNLLCYFLLADIKFLIKPSGISGPEFLQGDGFDSEGIS